MQVSFVHGTLGGERCQPNCSIRKPPRYQRARVPVRTSGSISIPSALVSRGPVLRLRAFSRTPAHRPHRLPCVRNGSSFPPKSKLPRFVFSPRGSVGCASTEVRIRVHVVGFPDSRMLPPSSSLPIPPSVCGRESREPQCKITLSCIVHRVSSGAAPQQVFPTSRRSRASIAPVRVSSKPLSLCTLSARGISTFPPKHRSRSGDGNGGRRNDGQANDERRATSDERETPGTGFENAIVHQLEHCATHRLPFHLHPWPPTQNEPGQLHLSFRLPYWLAASIPLHLAKIGICTELAPQGPSTVPNGILLFVLGRCGWLGVLDAASPFPSPCVRDALDWPVWNLLGPPAQHFPTSHRSPEAADWLADGPISRRT